MAIAKVAGRKDICGRELGSSNSLSAIFPKSVSVDVGGGLCKCAWVGQLQALLRSAGVKFQRVVGSKRGVANAKKVLVHHQCRGVFVRNTHPIFIFDEGIGRELVIDEHSVLVVIPQFQSIIDVGCSHNIKLLSARCDGHLSVIVFYDVYFLRDGHHGAICSHVICVVNGYGVVAIRSNTDKSAFISHS